MGIQPKPVDDLELFEAYTNRSVDDFEVEEIEEIIDKIHKEYEPLLSIKDSNELGVIVAKGLTAFTFSFTKDGEQINASLKPIMDLMFGSSNDVEEISPNTFTVVNGNFSDVKELDAWVKSNTPFSNTTVVEPKQAKGSTNSVSVNGVNVTLNGLTDDQRQQRRWEHFETKFPEERRVLVTVRNSRFNSKVSMKLVTKFGNFDEGMWDIFNMEGNTTVQTLLDEREENNDPNPVTYIIGFSEKASPEKIKEFQKFINRLKLTSKS